MKFESQKVNYVGRYGGFIIVVCMWIISFIFEPLLFDMATIFQTFFN